MKYSRILLISILTSCIILSCTTESTPVYQLTTSSNPPEAGSVTPEQNEYDEGTEVTITATPNEGWTFDSWQGDVSSSENPIQIVVEQPTQITAIFEEKNTFYLEENEITIKCPLAEVGEKGSVNGIEYEAVDLELLRQRVEEDAVLSKVCTSLVTEMDYIFENQNSFNQPIGNWDVSNVISMDGLFLGASSFNQPIESWDVSEVTSMYRMFGGATSFNQAIGNWNTEQVTIMLSMFSGANSFNQPIENWDVSNVNDMTYMFSAASSFDQPIQNWDVSNVTLMLYMFNGAESFNQSIGDWDVSSVVMMSGMFEDAINFNQPIDNWDVSNVTDMDALFNGAEFFNQDLTGWCVSNIESEPTDFANESALDEENKPKWGTCPD